MPVIRHTHKYERVTQGKNGRIIHVCRLPNCTHFLTPELIVGKECVCWKCGDKLIITGELKYKKRPTCDEHKAKKESLEKLAPSTNIDALLESLGVKK